MSGCHSRNLSQIRGAHPTSSWVAYAQRHPARSSSIIEIPTPRNRTLCCCCCTLRSRQLAFCRWAASGASVVAPRARPRQNPGESVALEPDPMVFSVAKHGAVGKSRKTASPQPAPVQTRCSRVATFAVSSMPPDRSPSDQSRAPVKQKQPYAKVTSRPALPRSSNDTEGTATKSLIGCHGILTSLSSIASRSASILAQRLGHRSCSCQSKLRSSQFKKDATWTA